MSDTPLDELAEKEETIAPPKRESVGVVSSRRTVYGNAPAENVLDHEWELHYDSAFTEPGEEPQEH